MYDEDIHIDTIMVVDFVHVHRAFSAPSSPSKSPFRCQFRCCIYASTLDRTPISKLVHAITHVHEHLLADKHCMKLQNVPRATLSICNSLSRFHDVLLLFYKL